MSKIIYAQESKPIVLGHAGDNDAVEVVFNIEKLIDDYGEGECLLLHQRCGDAAGYLCQTNRQGNTLHWLIKNTDTAVEGQGRCELTYSVDNVVVKSEIFMTMVRETILNGENVPEPWRDWVEDVLAAAQNIQEMEDPTLSIGNDGHLYLTKGNNTETDLGYIKGEQGPKGDTGETGPQGPKGDTGETGLRGPGSNINLLDNPWFTVNQRAVTEYEEGEYGVDRWKLISGSATVTENGIQLNGTLRQIREFAVGGTTHASVKMHSGTAAATYNDSTKYFDIVSSGGVIRAAKLEIGTVSTLADDTAPSYAEELLKCQRYYQKISKFPRYAGTVTNAATNADVQIPLATPMRSTPTLTGFVLSNYRFADAVILASATNYACSYDIGSGVLNINIADTKFSTEKAKPFMLVLDAASPLPSISADL